MPKVMTSSLFLHKNSKMEYCQTKTLLHVNQQNDKKQARDGGKIVEKIVRNPIEGTVQICIRTWQKGGIQLF